MTYFSFQPIQPCISEKEPFIQLADLFVGMSVYSWKASAIYCEWLLDKSSEHLGKADKYRCQILDNFYQGCINANLSISFIENGKGFFTPSFTHKININLYQS